MDKLYHIRGLVSSGLVLLWYNNGMNIALLGYGLEGKAAEKYFKSHYADAHFDIFENLTPAEFAEKDYSSYDMILRSPSVPPFKNEKLTSITEYFFEHCPCKIIGVTATKGKGTTCSFIKFLLDAEGYDAYLVGNIGTPAIEILDRLTKDSVVVYELSSFQLWHLQKSPHIAIIGQIEPDHLNVHSGYDDYLAAKGNLVRYQSESDICIYYAKNPESKNLAELSKARKIPYPFSAPDDILKSITLPGAHNTENALAAIAAVAALKNLSPEDYCANFADTIKRGLNNFHGLPHRLEFVRELNSVRYYDDNFSTNPSSTRVAINAFPDDKIILIAGGRDKTGGEDLPEIYKIIKTPNIAKIILIGESGHELARRYHDPRFRVANSLEAAITAARLEAESIKPSVVIMSPAAASFDMFQNVYDRGAKYKTLVTSLQ